MRFLPSTAAPRIAAGRHARGGRSAASTVCASANSPGGFGKEACFFAAIPAWAGRLLPHPLYGRHKRHGESTDHARSRASQDRRGEDGRGSPCSPAARTAQCVRPRSASPSVATAVPRECYRPVACGLDARTPASLRAVPMIRHCGPLRCPRPPSRIAKSRARTFIARPFLHPLERRRRFMAECPHQAARAGGHRSELAGPTPIARQEGLPREHRCHMAPLRSRNSP